MYQRVYDRYVFESRLQCKLSVITRAFDCYVSQPASQTAIHLEHELLKLINECRHAFAIEKINMRGIFVYCVATDRHCTCTCVYE